MEASSFHEVGRLFPGDITVQTVPPGTLVGDALRVMLEKRYSQLPVLDGDKIRGVFSFWSLAHQLTIAPNMKLHELTVEDAMEQIPSVRVTDSLHSILALLEQHEALLVDSPRGLQAIATPLDVLRYFYRVARPFILLQEIELAVRSLIDLCAQGRELEECIGRALAKECQKSKRKLPAELRELSLEDSRLVITTRANWPIFEPVLGRNRNLVSVKLERVREIRNEVFHFRTEISVLDYQTLANVREWLLDKVRLTGTARRGEEDV